MGTPRHVIVCGAGVVGASVAYFLARRGMAVTLAAADGAATTVDLAPFDPARRRPARRS